MSRRDEDITGSQATREASFSEADIRQRGPLVHFLTSQSFSLALTAGGAGVVAFDGLALNRWLPDPVREDASYVLYLRDRDDGRYWSAALQPDVLRPDHYDVRSEPGRVRIERLQDGVRSVMDVFLSDRHNAELRLLTLRNEGHRPRRLDVTSFVEIALNEPEADQAHPAFSRLFVQTRFDAATRAIHAWRRQRSPDERPARLVHCAFGDGVYTGFETSRPHFVGRARSARDPVAMRRDGALEGISGSVLDPAAVLRRQLDLDAGAEARILFVLGAGRDEQEIDAMIADLSRSGANFEVLPKAAAAVAPGMAGRLEADAFREHVLSSLGMNAADVARVSPSAEGPPPRRTNGAATRKPEPALYHRADDAAPADGGARAEPLLFENGYGGFSEDGRTYVIRVHPDGEGGMHLPPQPWTNVIANEQIGFIVSETGAACTWSRNSRENRLTPWFNDFVSDPHGEALYVRDDDAHTYWSATPGPAPAPAA